MFIIYIVCCIISSAAASTQIHSDFQLCQKGNCITIDTIQVPRKVSRCTKDFLVGFYLENTFTLGFLIKNNTLVRKSEEEICSPYTTTYAFSSFVATRVGNEIKIEKNYKSEPLKDFKNFINLKREY